MLEEIDDLHETLVQSDIWSEDHIKIIKGEAATVTNIISGLKWLDKKEDENDFSLVYITTHGSPLGIDIPPFDEEDGTDEILVSYWGFAYPRLFLYDDQLNFRLNQLESQGVCFIVDSCYAGGFNDPPNWLDFNNNFSPQFKKDISMSADEWMEGFGEELSGQKRVILMASCEDEVSYSGGFAPYLIDGLKGHADVNSDEIITAEEAFYYLQPRTNRQHPTLFDDYPGELPLIYLSDSLKNSEKNQDISINEKMISKLYLEGSDENSVIKGFIKDSETSSPIKNALIYVQGRTNDWEFFQNETITDSNGFYFINVPQCRCRVSVNADGYCIAESMYTEVDENQELWLNFSLYYHPPEKSIIYGYITDNDTDDPVAEANISLLWHGDENQYYRNDTKSDSFGYYQINIAAGEIDIEVEKSNYFHEHLDDIIIPDYQNIEINFSLISRPIENSVISGYIKDKETGDPINNARVEFEWIDISSGHSYDKDVYTNDTGFYSLNIAAGEIYMDIRIGGYEYYDPYRHDTKEKDVLWLNISLEKQKIEVDIAKPLQAFYINNIRLFPYSKTRIIGKIDIEAYPYQSWYHGPNEVEKVEFYIDGILKETITSEPYIWTWDETDYGKHKIKIVVYDFDGDSNSKEIEVYKFL